MKLKCRQARVQSLADKSQELQSGMAGPQIFLTCLFTNHQKLNSVNKTWEAADFWSGPSMQLQRTPRRHQEVTHLVLWTKRARWEDTKLLENLPAASKKYHCVLCVGKGTTERKRQHCMQTTASKNNYLNTLCDGGAHWSHPRGAPSITRMHLVSWLALSHAKHISIAERHKVHGV